MLAQRYSSKTNQSTERSNKRIDHQLGTKTAKNSDFDKIKNKAYSSVLRTEAAENDSCLQNDAKEISLRFQSRIKSNQKESKFGKRNLAAISVESFLTLKQTDEQQNYGNL